MGKQAKFCAKDTGQNVSSTIDHFDNYARNCAQGILVHIEFVPLYVNSVAASMLGYDDPGVVRAMDTVLPLISPVTFRSTQSESTGRASGDQLPERYRLEIHRAGAPSQLLECFSSTMIWHGERATVTTMVDAGKTAAADSSGHETEQIRAEGEDLLREFVRTLPDWYWETDVDHRFVDRFQWPYWIPQKNYGRKRWEIATAEDVGANTEKWREHRNALNDHRPFKDFRYQSRNQNNEVIWLRTSGRPVFDSQGIFKGYRGFASDITEVVSAENRARTAREQLMAAVDAFDAPVVLFDPDDCVVLSNEAYKRMFDDRDGSITPGRHVEDLTRHLINTNRFPEAIGCEEEWLAERLQRFRQGNQPFEVRRANGDVYLVRDVRLPDGSTLVIPTNITERIKAEHALNLAKVAAEQASQSKTRFLAAASHDLRQPLQALTLYVDMLSSYVHAGKGVKVISNIRDNVRSMAGMLDMLLEISEFDGGVIKTNIAPISVASVLHRLERDFAVQAGASRIGFKTVGCSLWIESDAELLTRILENFASNAIRYSGGGRVLVGCRRHARSLTIEVWDTGIGIPEDQLDAIFEEYHQLHNPARDRSKGLGLGLSVVKRIANLLGHTIEVRSIVGKGSMFAVSVPVTTPPFVANVEKIKSAPVPVDLTGKHVILAENDDRVRDGIHQVLAANGAEVHSFYNASDVAVTLAGATWHPALAIVDYWLGDGVTGAAVVCAIRRQSEMEVPAIIMTGDMGPGPKQSAREADCEVLYKPVARDTICAAISRALS